MNQTPRLTTQSPIPRSWWVQPGQLLAGPFPGTPDPDELRRRIAALLDAGVRTFINLQEPTETGGGPTPFPDYRPAVEAEASEAIQVVCHRFPVPDATVPPRSTLKRALVAIEEGLGRGVVYVHCWGGHGRTGALVGCWLQEQGLTGDAALRHIAAARQHDPHLACRPAPETPAQRALVMTYSFEARS